jgi:hypothetical protein
MLSSTTTPIMASNFSACSVPGIAAPMGGSVTKIVALADKPEAEAVTI